MGKNNKRKAAVIVLAVVAIALTAFPFVSALFGLDKIAQNASAYSGTGSTSGTIYGGDLTTTESGYLSLDSGVYALVFSGQATKNNASGYYGPSATCLAFYKGGGFNLSIGGNGGYGGVNNATLRGGGSTKVYSNFALPNGITKDDYAIAAGGGATSDWNLSAEWWRYGRFEPTTAEYYVNDLINYSHSVWGVAGYPAMSDITTKQINGYHVGSSKSGYTTTNYYGGGGGAGYINGGGGSGASISSLGCGGGGSSSSNCYPIHAQDAKLSYEDSRSNGNSRSGYVNWYRIDPDTEPTVNNSGNTNNGTINDPTNAGTRCTLNSVKAMSGKVIGNYIKADWVYSYRTYYYDSSGWSSWSKYSTTAPTLSKPGKMEVNTRYIIYATGSTSEKYPSYKMKYTSSSVDGAANDANYIIKRGTTLTLTKRGTASVATAPVGNTLTYTGSAQKLLKSAAVSKRGTLDATTEYRVNGGTPTTDWQKVTGTNAGKYVIEYRAKGDTSYYNDSDWSTLEVTIAKRDPNLNEGTLAKKSGLIYNQRSQQLFTGQASTLGGEIRYYVTQSSTAGPAAMTTGYTNIADCKGLHAVDKSDKQITYYLWYKCTDAAANHIDIGWTFTGLSNTLAKVTFDISATLMSPQNYNGNAKQIITSVEKTGNSSFTNNYIVNYTVKSTHADDFIRTETAEQDYSVLQRTTACKIEVSASWRMPNATEDASELALYQFESGSKVLGTTEIYQIKNASQIEVTGLELNQNLQISATNQCKPFKSSAVDLVVCNNSGEDNAITNGPKNRATDGQESNLISYCLTKKTLDFVDDSDFEPTYTAEELNDAIEGLTVNDTGTWYLYFLIDRHYNLIEGTKFKAAEFYVEPYSIPSENLKGITMSPTVTYDGNSHSIAQGELTVVGIEGIDLGAVKYAVNNIQKPPADEYLWVDTVAELPEQTEAGKYYLFAKWTGTNSSTGNLTGYSYGSFTIEKYDAANAHLYFMGDNFAANGWQNTDMNSSFIYYNRPFDNLSYSFGTMNGPTAFVNNNDKIKSKDFGEFSFATGDDLGPTSSYLPVANYAGLTVKNVNIYYLWIKWTGSNNIKPGSTLYKMRLDSNLLTPVFTITKMQTTANLSFANQNFASSKGSLKYEYTFVQNGSTGYANGVEQPLFNTVAALPTIKISNVIYPNYMPGITYQYLVAKDGVEITYQTPGWQPAIEDAKATDVGTYKLWVLVTINNDDINISQALEVDTITTEITATESFVAIAPTAKPESELIANGNDLQLIEASGQTPALEYAVLKSKEVITNDTVWTTDVTQIVGRDAGTYYVYYRGAAESPSFITQSEPQSGYLFLSVFIDFADSKFSPRPSALPNVVFTGRPLETFTPGASEFADQKIPLRYNWDINDDNGWVLYEELPKLVDAGSYILYYRANSEDCPDLNADVVGELPVRIYKADIEKGSLYMPQEDLIFKGANYSLILNEIDYVIGTISNPLTNEAGLELYYSNRTRDDWTGGVMGSISYAVSTSADIVPLSSEWKNDYREVVARNVGDYYIWVRVDETGANHNGLSAVCCNSGNPISIVPVAETTEGCSYKNVLVSDSVYEVFADLRYNGLEQALIENLILNVKVADRNEFGEVLDTEGNTVDDNATSDDIKYNNIEITEIGTVYYAISTDIDGFPKSNDFSPTGWQNTWNTLTMVEANTYHLLLMIAGDSSINQFMFSFTLDAVDPKIIKIAPAAYEDIQVSGIVGTQAVYTGEPQAIASGKLVVKINDFDAKQQIVTENLKYCFVKVGEVATESSNWTAWEDTKITNVAEYQLWVWLAVKNNIDGTTKSLIYPVLDENYYAEILRVDINSLDVVAPEFSADLIYNGLNQKLLIKDKDASLKMKNGNELFGGPGAITYYISSSFAEITNVGTTNGGVDKKYSLEQVEEINVGTYYIWVEFAAGESHEDISPVCVGSVTIKPETGENINISGVEFTRHTYSGEFKQLITTEVVQKFNDGDRLVAASDYAKIEYAYSSDANIRPSDDAWVEDITLLTARNAGKYYIWVSVTGKPNTENGQNNITDYIKCYANEETDYAQIGQAILEESNFDGITFNQNLVYIAESQVLATIQDKLIIRLKSEDLNTAEHNSDLNVYWALGQNAEDAPSTGWFNRIEDLQGINSQKYYIWVWVQECKNFEEIQIYLGCVEIAKGTIVFDNQSIGNNLTYNGSYQELLSAGRSIQFYAPGYAQEYYNINGIEIQYQNSTLAGAWSTNYRDVKGLNATTFTVRYQVPETDNWKLAEDEIQVTIKPADASTNYIGLVEAPTAKLSLFYNEQEQELISYGVLSSVLGEPGCGAALEGVKIVFYYESDPQKTEYKYYYDQVSGTYIWENDQPLPGKVNAGNYLIHYYVTASSNGNFKQSEVKDINTTINKREIYWDIAPKGVNGLYFIGTEQRIVNPGYLNVGSTDPYCTAAGVTVWYTFDSPYVGTRDWSMEIPVAVETKIWPIWYRLELDDNNVFVGEQNNDTDGGTMLTISLNKNMLTIRDYPKEEILPYAAEEQTLVNYSYLSTDNFEIYGDKKPYFEYSLDKVDWKPQAEFKAKERGKYTIYYRINYDPTYFEFKGENDGQVEPMVMTTIIDKLKIEEDSIRAIYVTDENGGYLTYSVNKRVKDGVIPEDPENPKDEELENIYSDKLLAEIEDYINYYYRKYDAHTQSEDWLPWTDGMKVSDLEMGGYQFMLKIESEDQDTFNFETYTQAGNIPYASCESLGDRFIDVVMEDFNTPAYIRGWVDYTGTMTYMDSPAKFEDWVSQEGQLEMPFRWLNSTGLNNQARIRLEVTNGNFYYMTTEYLDKDARMSIPLDTAKVSNASGEFNVGLTEERITVYLYEVYHIQYDANGGIGDSLAEGWKWHDIDYLLAENKFTKTDNGYVMTANGWNTSKAGNGNNYNSSSSMVYSEDASQIFYAKFFGKDEKFYTINWIIRDLTKNLEYKLSRDFSVWYNTAEYGNTRDSGVLVLENDIITLPQVAVDEKGNSLAEIFGGYVLGWETEDTKISYSIGMPAVRDLTFVAVLNKNLDDAVRCQFIDADDKVVHDSGLVANGAQAYMALSGMNAKLISDYQEGYDKWVEVYAYDYLDKTQTPDGIIKYALGTKQIEETPPTPKKQLAWADYIPMIIVLVVGIAPVILCLVVYLIQRQKRDKKATK